jgi:hypothetical protein
MSDATNELRARLSAKSDEPEMSVEEISERIGGDEPIDPNTDPEIAAANPVLPPSDGDPSAEDTDVNDGDDLDTSTDDDMPNSVESDGGKIDADDLPDAENE